MPLGWTMAEARQSVSRSMLRRLLLQLAPTPADFDRLCIDFAPYVHGRFSSGMDRVSQTNLLLRMAPTHDVLAALRELAADQREFEQQLAQAQADPRNARECEIDALSHRLERCLLERDRLRSERTTLDAGAIDALNKQIVELKREIRRGPQLNAGEILADRYILCELIGRGGYGDVWQALDRNRQRFVAVKVLHGRREDPRSVERFERGARTMLQLDHPHIARVLEEPADHDDFHYYVMEYLAGGDLEHAQTRRRITQVQALHAILQAGDALQYAHARGLVHRDVKPQNILLNNKGAARLTDFDLVLVDDSTGGTATGAFVGTILYVAPEVLDDASAADARSDVYSLGMSLLFVLLGRPLPRSSNRDSLLHACPQAEPALLNIVQRATAPISAERYASAAEFCDALQTALRRTENNSGPFAGSAHAAPILAEAATMPVLANTSLSGLAVQPLASGSESGSVSPSQQSQSLVGFALPPPTRASLRRIVSSGALGALAIGSLAAGYYYVAHIRQPTKGSLHALSLSRASTLNPTPEPKLDTLPATQPNAPAAIALPMTNPAPPASSRTPLTGSPSSPPTVSEPIQQPKAKAVSLSRVPKSSLPSKRVAPSVLDDSTDILGINGTTATSAFRRTTKPTRTASLANELNEILSSEGPRGRASQPSKPPIKDTVTHSGERLQGDSSSVMKQASAHGEASVPTVDVDNRLSEAQIAYVNSNYQTAIELALTVQKASPMRAWRIIGSAACVLKDLKRVNDAYRRLDAPGRQYLTYVCQRNQLMLVGTQFKPLE